MESRALVLDFDLLGWWSIEKMQNSFLVPLNTSPVSCSSAGQVMDIFLLAFPSDFDPLLEGFQILSQKEDVLGE